MLSLKPTKATLANGRAGRRGGLTLKLGVSVLVLGGASLGLIKFRGGNKPSESAGKDSGAETIRFTVKRDHLTLSALSSGTLKTKTTTQVINEVERQLKIIWVIDEGTQVKKGDKLVELDASDLNDQLLKQKVRMADVLQNVQKAEDDLAIAESKTKTDRIAAENTLKIAQLDLNKYKEGDYLQTKRQLESSVALAEEDLKRAKDRLNWTQKLAGKGYVTQEDLEADQFAVKKTAIQLDSAKENLNLLQKFTFDRETTRLSTSLAQAQGDFERIVLSDQRELSSRKSAVEAAKTTAAFEEINTHNIEDQIAKAVIRAPQDGMVVYFKERWRGQEQVLQVGTTVSSRQRLIDLPDFSSWIVEARIHESMIQQIRAGLPAFVTLDAFPDALLQGKVGRIAVLPDNTQWYRDAQEYIVEIDLDANQSNFKPGMSAKSEIILGERENVLVVPLQAVNYKDGKTVVRVEGEAGIQEQEVEVGANNERFVEIASGLSEGQVVKLDQTAGQGSGLGPRPSEKASDEERQAAGDEATKPEKNSKKPGKSKGKGHTQAESAAEAGKKKESSAEAKTAAPGTSQANSTPQDQAKGSSEDKRRMREKIEKLTQEKREAVENRGQNAKPQPASKP